jgi:hypothetical protein
MLVRRQKSFFFDLENSAAYLLPSSCGLIIFHS